MADTLTRVQRPDRVGTGAAVATTALATRLQLAAWLLSKSKSSCKSCNCSKKLWSQCCEENLKETPHLEIRLETSRSKIHRLMLHTVTNTAPQRTFTLVTRFSTMQKLYSLWYLSLRNRKGVFQQERKVQTAIQEVCRKECILKQDQTFEPSPRGQCKATWPVRTCPTDCSELKAAGPAPGSASETRSSVLITSSPDRPNQTSFRTTSRCSWFSCETVC